MPEEILEQEQVLEQPVVICGHINKHFHGVDGRLADLSCTLLAEHDGDHCASAPALRQVEDNFETATRVEEGAKKYTIAGKLYITTVEDAFWSDAAGVPAAEIEPDLEQLKALKKAKNAE